MKRSLFLRTACLLLPMLLLFTACADSAGGSTKTDSPEEVPDYGDGLRYQAAWTKDAIIYEVNVRQYTPEGTFGAFAGHLQEIRDLGVNTLWFMPIHPISVTNRSGTLGSYYSVTDYREVNPEFGTSDDFKALVDQAHEMGFRVMLDWVANHTGWDCAWKRSILSGTLRTPRAISFPRKALTGRMWRISTSTMPRCGRR